MGPPWASNTARGANCFNLLRNLPPNLVHHHHQQEGVSFIPLFFATTVLSFLPFSSLFKEFVSQSFRSLVHTLCFSIQNHISRSLPSPYIHYSQVLNAMVPHIAAWLLFFYVACSSALDIRDADDEQCVIEYVTVYGNGPPAGTGSTASPSTLPISTTYHIPTHMPVPLKQASASIGAQGSDGSSSSAGSPISIPSSSGSTTAAAAEATSDTTSPTQSSAAPSSSTPSTGAKSNITPGGKKAGISGYGNIAMMADWSQFTPHISWYSDYTPNPPDSGDVKGIGMVRSSPFLIPFPLTLPLSAFILIPLHSSSSAALLSTSKL